MKIQKEYPATHSMSTAWYCADEDGNVGVFDIDDNGPVPEESDQGELCVEDILWYELASANKENGIRYFNLTSEQINLLISRPNEDRGEWKKDYNWYNYAWMDVIIKIDMSKFELFKQVINADPDHHMYYTTCLSKERGLFYIDLGFDKLGVETLEQDNVILEKYDAPRYLKPEYEEDSKVPSGNAYLPFYVYLQDYSLSAHAAEKIVTPKFPLTIEQLPEEVRRGIKRLPVKFKEARRIQLAEYMPVRVSCGLEVVFENLIWTRLISSKGDPIYYNAERHAIISGEEMNKNMADGKAEEYDYDKHHHLR